MSGLVLMVTIDAKELFIIRNKTITVNILLPFYLHKFNKLLPLSLIYLERMSKGGNRY